MDENAVTLEAMLEARERRSFRQRELLTEFQSPLISFTMNIAGPIKNSPLILRGFEMGKEQLLQELHSSGCEILNFEEIKGPTGNEAFFSVRAEPLALKRLTVEIENHSSIGRLFDMDVLNMGGEQINRGALDLPERTCLLCGNPGKECSRSRAHPVEELQEKTEQLLRDFFQAEDARTIAQMASQSLLYEVCTTPKPGLVDCVNSGSHKDMDIFTFMSSVSALWPYFEECGRIGLKTAALGAGETFRHLRQAGKWAEKRMNTATKGVNTHKGAIFSIGLLCGAFGRAGREQWPDAENVLAECAAMTKGLVKRELFDMPPKNAGTTGQRLYVQYGVTGIRGQAEAGFPAVLDAGLPTLEHGLAGGLSLNDAGCNALLALITATADTNLIARSDRETQQAVVKQVTELRKKHGFLGRELLEQLDEEWSQRNLSPGGSADLLAMTYMLHFMKEMG